MDDGSTKRLNRRILMPIPEESENGVSDETENAPNPDGDVPIQEEQNEDDVTQEAIHETRPPTTDHLEDVEAGPSPPTLRRSSRKHAVKSKCACCEVSLCKVISSNKNSSTIAIIV